MRKEWNFGNLFISILYVYVYYFDDNINETML